MGESRAWLSSLGADPWRHRSGRSPGWGGRRRHALAAMGPGRDALAIFYGGRGEAREGESGEMEGIRDETGVTGGERYMTKVYS